MKEYVTKVGRPSGLGPRLVLCFEDHCMSMRLGNKTPTWQSQSRMLQPVQDSVTERTSAAVSELILDCGKPWGGSKWSQNATGKVNLLILPWHWTWAEHFEQQVSTWGPQIL